MARRTNIYYSATLVGVAVILCVLAVRCLTGPGEVPATSIPNTKDSPTEKPASPYLTHRPTILKADAALAPPVDDQPQSSPAPSGFRGHITDDDSPSLREASPAEFLPIPSLDAPERQ
jgi:hypothetical protein